MTGQDFSGRTIVVTGAAQGQGAEEARRLAAAGARVVLADVQDERGTALAAEIGAEYHRLDVSSEADWAALEAHLAARGGLHGLVSNAAIYVPGGVDTATAADFERHFRVNQLGTFLGLRAAARTAVAGASVVIVSSVMGLKGIPNSIAYVSTKWAIRGMAKAAAVELAARGVRVNSIHPGIIDTHMLDAWAPGEFERRVARIPAGRPGEVSDVASVVLFLLDDASAYMTGSEIAIDGGLSL